MQDLLVALVDLLLQSLQYLNILYLLEIQQLGNRSDDLLHYLYSVEDGVIHVTEVDQVLSIQRLLHPHAWWCIFTQVACTEYDQEHSRHMDDVKARANLIQAGKVLVRSRIWGIATGLFFISRWRSFWMPCSLSFVPLITYLLFGSCSFLLLFDIFNIFASQYTVCHSHQGLKHHLAPLLGEEDERLEEHLQGLSNQRLLPIEFLVKPLD